MLASTSLRRTMASYFACPHCRVVDVAKANLKKHVSRVHKVKPFSCFECGSGFTNFAEMKKHSKAEHGVVLREPYEVINIEAVNNSRNFLAGVYPMKSDDETRMFNNFYYETTKLKEPLTRTSHQRKSLLLENLFEEEAKEDAAKPIYAVSDRTPYSSMSKAFLKSVYPMKAHFLSRPLSADVEVQRSPQDEFQRMAREVGAKLVDAFQCLQRQFQNYIKV